MRRLFDTSVAIGLRDGHPRIVERAAQLHPVALLSVISVVELEGGVATAKEGRVQRRRALDAMYDLLDVLPYTEKESTAYGQIVAELGFSRAAIVDRMIASQAIVAGAMLATLNARDFRDIPGLALEDWSG